MTSVPILAGTKHEAAAVSLEHRFPVSVMILTLNEADHIQECLAHLDWADEVILVDSYSSDDTVKRAIAARPELRVFEHAFTDFGDQRNWALDNTAPRHEWILFLDADEHCNADCADAIRKAINEGGKTAGYFLTCRNMFLGRWIRHATMYPSWQLRLLHRGACATARKDTASAK